MATGIGGETAVEGLDRDLRQIVTAVEIRSMTSYRIEGVLRQVAEEPATEPVDPSEVLRQAIEDGLYRDFYLRRREASRMAVDRLARRDHVARLSRANHGQGNWQPGWVLQEVGEIEGGITVNRDGVIYRTDVGDVRDSGGRDCESGARCRVRIAKEARGLLPGFYLAYGDADAATEPPPFLVRMYWHLRSAAAVPLMRRLTEGLNRRGVPFRVKVLSAPEQYRRADAGVLYLEPTRVDAARDDFEASYRDIAQDLRPQVPMLTAAIAPGLGVAEGPADGGSFGRHRCGLIASALVKAFLAGRHKKPHREATVKAAFREYGLDPLHPYRAPGSVMVYRSFELGTIAPTVLVDRPGLSLLEAARALGDSLCRNAHWHRERCNWIGRSSREANPESRVLRHCAGALGATLYSGTAGVGMFLAQLFAFSGSPEHRRAALGSARQALRSITEGDVDRPPLAYFSGQLGVARAASKIARLTGSKRLAERAVGQLSRLVGEPLTDESMDVIRGRAGATLALLGLHREGGDPGLLALAMEMGERICRSAVRDESFWSWIADSAAGDPDGPRLTGFSHGAAGIGLALLELWSATERPTFHEAAMGAFAYEDSLFDRERCNWPDLRATVTERAAELPVFSNAWCHGAPGIVLSRFRAMVLDPDRAAGYEPAARAGLATTLEALTDRLEEPGADASLCHGLCGLIEVALIAGTVLGDDEPVTLARRAMRQLLARHGSAGDWPSGVASRGPNPSLMLGTAGIGYTMLRLHDPDGVPSVLLPGT